MAGSPPTATQRVFVALDPPLSVRQELAAWLRLAQVGRNLRPIEPGNMHLTLIFLGQRGEAEISLIASVLDEFADQAPALAIGAPVWLPRRNPRAFAVEVRPLDAALARVQSGIVSSLGGVLDLREPRSFHPHITVARLPRTFRARREPPPPTPQLEFEAESLSIYRSHLRPEGAEYEAIRSWELPASPGERPAEDD